MVMNVDVMMMNSNTDQSERAKSEISQDGRWPSCHLCVCRLPANVQRCQLPGKQPRDKVARPPPINDQGVPCNAIHNDLFWSCQIC